MNQNYSETIKDHYKHPRNAGKLSDYTHTAELVNPLCGDEIKVYIKLSRPESGSRFGSGKILDIAYEARGCMIAVASASVVSEFARGKKLSEIKKLGVQQVSELLDVSISPARSSCACLVLDAMKKPL